MKKEFGSPNRDLSPAHQIAHEIHQAAETRFPNGKHAYTEEYTDRINTNPDEGFPTGYTLHLWDTQHELKNTSPYQRRKVKIDDGLSASKGATYPSGEKKKFQVEPSYYKRPLTPSPESGFNIPIFENIRDHQPTPVIRIDREQREMTRVREQLAALATTVPYAVHIEPQNENGHVTVSQPLVKTI